MNRAVLVVVLAVAVLAVAGLVGSRFRGGAAEPQQQPVQPPQPPAPTRDGTDAEPADEGPPSAEEIMNRHIEATGGREAHQKLRNALVRESMVVKILGAKFIGVKHVAPPNMLHKKYDTSNLRMEAGTNGRIAWQAYLDQPATVIQGQDKNLLMREATLYFPLHWKGHYKKAECVGLADIDGEPCYEVTMTPPAGLPETRYYSADSGLLVKEVITVTRGMGDIELESRFDDYRPVGDVLVFHKITQTQVSQESVITTESVEFNVEIPPDRFDLPPLKPAPTDGDASGAAASPPPAPTTQPAP